MSDLEQTAREIANAISKEHGHGYTALYDVMERHIAKGLSAVREADAKVADSLRNENGDYIAAAIRNQGGT